MKRIPYRTSLVVLTLALVVLGVGGAVSQGRAAQQPGVIHAEISFVTDLHDARRLVGLVDNVFVGRVVAQAGTHKPDGRLPETLFTVEVVRAIKGSLAGSVTVNQQGGFSEEDNAVILMENDQLLEPGTTYLFATRASEGGQWHTLVPGFGDLRIGSEQEQAALVQKFEKALREQIAYQP